MKTFGLAMGVILALMTTACGSDSDNNGSDGATNTTLTDTGVETDTSLTTDTTVADTTSSFECTTDGDCSETGAICSCEGTCVVPTTTACETDLNCGIPNWCNPCTKHCEVQAFVCDECSDSAACRDGGVCVPYALGGNYCGAACITDAGCAKGYVCVDVSGATNKQCVARSGRCEDLGLCEDDGDCPDAMVCNAGSGECGQGCTEDAACVDGKVCQAGRCVDPCTTSAECTDPAECDTVAGKCKVPGACELSADCPDAETYCDKTEGACKAGCLIDDNCRDASKECVAQTCQSRGCEHNFTCAFNEVCNKSTGDCVPTTEPHCAPCGEGADQACDEPNLCAMFQDEEEVDQGEFCLLPCADDPIDKCPQGYGCQRVEDQDGNELFFCARQCYYDPVAP